MGRNCIKSLYVRVKEETLEKKKRCICHRLICRNWNWFCFELKKTGVYWIDFEVFELRKNEMLVEICRKSLYVRVKKETLEKKQKVYAIG